MPIITSSESTVASASSFSSSFSPSSSVSSFFSASSAASSTFSHASTTSSSLSTSSARLSRHTEHPSSPPSSPNSSSSSSFRSTFSSSSSSPSTSFIALTKTVVAQPSTSSDVVSVTATPTASITTPASSASANSASTGFWSKKRDVVATFTVVGLLACGVVGGAVYIVMRQRQRDKAAEELFGGPDVTHSISTAPSLGHVTNYAQTEAYLSRDVHFGSNYMGQPSGDSSVSPYYQNTHAGHVEIAPQGGNNSSSAPRRAPIQAGNAPPVSYRLPRGRDSFGYQPSIDSFYGGAEER